MTYFVVYKNREIIDGPLYREQAEAICEDLDMALEDKGYRVVDEQTLINLGLRGEAKYHIQEDAPIVAN